LTVLLLIERPAAIMADGPAPSRDANTSPENFHDTARSAGEELKGKLHENFESGRKIRGIVSFEMSPYDGILEKVKAQFAAQVGNITIACEVARVT
jgi:hypothetical protein